MKNEIMEDLISRQYVLSKFNNGIFKAITNSEGQSAVDIVQNAPNAFDVDNVIAKITEKQLDVQEKFYGVEDEEFAVMLRGRLRGIADCLEIIKETIND